METPDARALPTAEPGDSPKVDHAPSRRFADHLHAGDVRALLSRWGVGIGALTMALWATMRSHSYFIWPYPMPLNLDEGYITAMALRMVRGHWLPYVDGVSQRGPITYWLATAVMRVGGLFSWTAMRFLALGLALSAIGLLFTLATELLTPFAAGIAVLVETYFLTYELMPWDGVGYNGEIVGVQFVLISALIIARVQLRPPAATRRWWARPASIFVAGALVACAGLSKQVTMTHLVPGFLWLLVGPSYPAEDPVDGSGPWFTRSVRRDLVAYMLGFLLPFGVVVGIYSAAGHLHEFVYYFQKYGRDIFMAPLTRDVMAKKLDEMLDAYLLGIAAIVGVTLFAIARAAKDYLATPLGPETTTRGARSRIRMRAHGASLFLLLHFGAACIGAGFSWRFFGHYFVEFYPFCGLVAGYALAKPFEDMDEHHVPSVVGGAIVVFGAALMLLVADATLHRKILERSLTERWYQRPKDDEIVRYVQQKTAPTDSIFVWGFRAEVYVSAERYPASRYIYTVYPAGVVPWFDATPAEEMSRVVPGSQEILLDDLEATKPELLIDAGRSMKGRYMYDLTKLRRYIDKQYCFARFVEGEPIYRRRHGCCCPAPDYPESR